MQEGGDDKGLLMWARGFKTKGVYDRVVVTESCEGRVKIGNLFVSWEVVNEWIARGG